MKNNVVDVLGVSYTIKYVYPVCKHLDGCRGMCSYEHKKIYIDLTLCDYTKTMVLRHELLHAFIYECGLGNLLVDYDEDLCDFLSYQIPKVYDIFKQANCV